MYAAKLSHITQKKLKVYFAVKDKLLLRMLTVALGIYIYILFILSPPYIYTLYWISRKWIV